MLTVKRWYALAALVLCGLVIGLDGTVLNVALATLSADLGATTGELQWIVAAYLVTFSVFLLPAGAAGDRWGRKRLLLAGVALFGASSALAAFATDAATLIAARAVMGVGAAIILPLSMSTLPVIFAENERSRAISVWTVGLALGLPLGPVVGGWLLENYWWGSVFLINIPVAAIAIAAGAVLLPESRDPSPSRLDVWSMLLSMTGLGLLVYGVIEAPVAGWGSAKVLATIGTGMVALVLFWFRDSLGTRRLFENKQFTSGTIATALSALALMGVLFVLPLRLQAVDGYTAMGTGLRLIPLIAGLMVTGKLAERLIARLGHRVVITCGMLLLSAGFLIGSFTRGYPMTAAWLFLAGLGLGAAMVPAMDAVLAALPPERAGAGSALVQTLRQVAGAFGVAGLGSLLNSVYGARLPANAPESARESIVAAVRDPSLAAAAREAFLSGMDSVLIACAAGAFLGAVIVAVFFRASAPAAVQQPDDPQRQLHPAGSAPEGQ
ncbi:MAG TPA: MFS transporter [Candidatus Limnocylindrales bacterium]